VSQHQQWDAAWPDTEEEPAVPLNLSAEDDEPVDQPPSTVRAQPPLGARRQQAPDHGHGVMTDDLPAGPTPPRPDEPGPSGFGAPGYTRVEPGTGPLDYGPAGPPYDPDLDQAPDAGPGPDLGPRGPLPPRGFDDDPLNPTRLPEPPPRTAPKHVPPRPELPGERPPPGPVTLSASDFTVERMMRLRKRAPQKGWQKVIYRASGGRLNPGLGAAELHEQELVARIGRPLDGCWRIASVAIKGGVGKSTTSVMLGHVFASMRGDRVVALDANPDAGTLGYRIRRQTAKTVKDLLNDAGRLERFADVRSYTSQAPSRLEVIASDNDPRVSEAFDDGDYREVSSILERFYSVIITDCGTGILHSTMRGILDLSDQLIVVTAPALDGGRSASLTLDWLDQHDRRDLVENAIVVINSIRPKGLIDLTQLEQHFQARCREVIRVPFDPHLEAGAETSLDELLPDTRAAYLELAATVADGFRT
jgi:MinD-like ATPase involved in chromosome partitioning or flagellar assembly